MITRRQKKIQLTLRIERLTPFQSFFLILVFKMSSIRINVHSNTSVLNVSLLEDVRGEISAEDSGSRRTLTLDIEVVLLSKRLENN